jgi:hypothetical protein
MLAMSPKSFPNISIEHSLQKSAISHPNYQIQSRTKNSAAQKTALIIRPNVKPLAASNLSILPSPLQHLFAFLALREYYIPQQLQ